MKKEEKFFLGEIYKEKITAQKRRGDLVTKKLGWVTGLLAAGIVNIKIAGNGIEISTANSFLVYVAPVISLVFDLYILGENYGIKRMGCYIRMTMIDTPDGNWETFVSPRRDIFSGFALFFSSMIILISSAIVLWHLPNNSEMFYIWIVILSVLLIFAHISAFVQLSALDNMTYQEYSEGKDKVYNKIFNKKDYLHKNSLEGTEKDRMNFL